jgi:AraC-like DNA-binding protein
VPAVIDYRTPARPGAVHRGLPSPNLTLVVAVGDPLPVRVPDAAGRPGAVREFRVCLGGLHLRPVLLPQDRPGAGIQLAVHPFAARALLGLPAGELRDQVVELADVLGPEADRLAEQVQDAVASGDPAAAAAAVERWLSRRLVAGRGAGGARGVGGADGAAGPERRDWSWGAWASLVGSGGRRRVHEVAAELDRSPRWVSASLRRETGLGAKELARTARLARSTRLLAEQPDLPLAQVADRCGFADQSHLSNEFAVLAGCTPSQWRRTEAPGVSREAPDDAAPEHVDRTV